MGRNIDSIRLILFETCSAPVLLIADNGQTYAVTAGNEEDARFVCRDWMIHLPSTARYRKSQYVLPRHYTHALCKGLEQPNQG